MEEHVETTCQNTLSIYTTSVEEPLSLQAFARLRALIINPLTPDSKLTLIFESLTRSLQLGRNSFVLHYTLKLLADLASYHPRFSRLVFDSVRSHSLFIESTRLTAESLNVLASIAERDIDLVVELDDLDDSFFASLCFRPSVSVRIWLLRNAWRFRVRPYLLFTLFLGFTKDPYPYVREVALEGLVRLSESGVIEDQAMIQGCYGRAVELLRDMEDCVRSSAVRAVCVWGVILAALNPETKAYCYNKVFAEVCSIARDMAIKVRVEAFNALGKIEVTSEDILLQTLSKRVLGITKEKKSHDPLIAGQFELMAPNVAGVVLHGLEDEYYEVRKSTCHALCMLTTFSAEFASEALTLLMDVLNDDSMVVRLQALETMHHMAIRNLLKVQEKHMHMFLGSLVDKDSSIRSAARKILKLVKLPVLKLFKQAVDALLENLETYPQDEADVFSILYYIGRSHGKFSSRIMKEISLQIELTSEGKLGFDTRLAALLVLVISASLFDEHNYDIPCTIFSYVVTFLGRISHALRDVMTQDDLLAYLSQRSKSTREAEQCLDSAVGGLPDDASEELNNLAVMPFQKCGTSKIQSPLMKEPSSMETSLVEYHLNVHDDLLRSINTILAKVRDVWPLVVSGNINKVLRTLRSCRSELASMTSDSLESADDIAFTLQYLMTIKLCAKLWGHFLPSMDFPCRMGALDLLLGKLDRRVREMTNRFMGLSKEGELHLLELVLVSCVFRLSKVEICCKLNTLEKLSCTTSRVKYLLDEGSTSTQPSNFLIELQNLSSKICDPVLRDSFGPLFYKKLLGMFSLKELILCGRLKHIKAELDVPHNDSEHSLSFVSGLPIGIPCEITLRNVLIHKRIWLRMSIDDESNQFLFLDLSLFGGCDEVRSFKFLAPFYRTPKASSFSIRLCIAVESVFEDIHFEKSCWGPKQELTYICQEKEVYLSSVSKSLQGLVKSQMEKPASALIMCPFQKLFTAVAILNMQGSSDPTRTYPPDS